MNIFKSSILPGWLLCLVVFFTACSRKDSTPITITSLSSFQDKINNGLLLNSFEKAGDDIVFNFEKGQFQVSEKEIKNIVTIPEQWKTIITFIDNSQITVPSKGSSLDFIVENILLNPTGFNPLAAKVNVALPTFGRIKVTVLGKNNASGNITHLCKETTAKQTVPILGLYPNYNNTIELAYTDLEGNERGKTQIKVQTTALPSTFPEQFLVKSMPEKMEPGVNLVNYNGESEIDLSVPYMVDNNGDVRWTLLLKSSPELNKLAASVGFKRTKNGTFIAGDQNANRIVELDMFGTLIRQWDILKLGYIFHHEISEAKNGNFLINVTKTNAKLTNGNPRINDIIIEFDPQNSSVVKEWDLTNMLDSSRLFPPDAGTPSQFGQSPTNWAHNNSVGEMGNDILATMRYQGVFCYTRAGKLRWIISPHKKWSPALQPYLLSPVDENGNKITDNAVLQGDASVNGFDWSWGPHTPVVINENHILVFDNGYNRNFKSNWSTSGNNYSRVVEYKIDEINKTVQQVWSYGKDRGESCFSPAMSGVQYLPQTKNVLFCPGMNVQMTKGKGGRIVEINPKNNEVVFDLELTSTSGYGFHRTQRMNLYPDTI